MKKVSISAVSYLNTLPFIYGMEQSPELLNQISLQKDIPSTCAAKLLANEVDLGLVPVAIIPLLKTPQIVSNFCISAIGKVKSVLLLSDVPLEEIKTILLDYQSRTSVKLCQLLAENFWNIQVDYQAGNEGYESKISGTTAGLIIGDRTFQLEKDYPYQYDLAEQWHLWQKLPFVFAAWVSNKKLAPSFIDAFNSALNFGVQNIEAALKQSPFNSIPINVQSDYLNNAINYQFDAEKHKALSHFLKLLKTH